MSLKDSTLNKRLSSIGLKWKFVIAIISVIFLLSTVAGTFIYINLSASLTHELQEKGISITRNLSADAVDPILTQNIMGLQHLVSNIRMIEEDVNYVFILDSKGSPMAHTFLRGFPSAMREINQPAAGEEYCTKLLLTEEGYIRDIAVPIFNDLGIVHVGISEKTIRHTVSETLWTLLAIALLVTIVGMSLATFFVISILRPLDMLTKGAREIGTGNLDHRIKIASKDEIGLLADTFNKMAVQLQNTFTRLEEEIDERNHAEERLKKANEEIALWNRDLEERVREKTEELNNSQAQLVEAEKLSAMGELAAGLAHELNSPLAGLLPLLEKHMTKAEPGSTGEWELSLMLKASNYMAKVIRDFGAFSRRSTGEFADLDLNEVVRSTLSFTSNPMLKKGIDLTTDLSDSLPHIKGNQIELQQVVLNMLNNAGDAMPKGGKLNIQTRFDKEEGMVMIEFSDNGKGMDKNTINKIFDPFFTTKTHGEGTGLGLSISYGIINNHNGKIMVDSIEGEGTKFSILIPAA